MKNSRLHGMLTKWNQSRPRAELRFGVLNARPRCWCWMITNSSKMMQLWIFKNLDQCQVHNIWPSIKRKLLPEMYNEPKRMVTLIPCSNVLHFHKKFHLRPLFKECSQSSMIRKEPVCCVATTSVDDCHVHWVDQAVDEGYWNLKPNSEKHPIEFTRSCRHWSYIIQSSMKFVTHAFNWFYIVA